MTAPQQQQPWPPASDAATDGVEAVIKAVLLVAVLVLLLPVAIPWLAFQLTGERVAEKTRFWVTRPWHPAAAAGGGALVAALLSFEALHLTGLARASGVMAALHHPAIIGHAVPWLAVNLAAGILLLPAAWILKRHRIAARVRARRIPDVVRQERIEAARKRAADQTTATRIGVRVQRRTGQVTGTAAITAPLALPGGRHSFGLVSLPTVRSLGERLQDLRQVRDWVGAAGRHVQLPARSSAARALILAESGSGKTVLISDLVLCALEEGWPVFVIDAKGDPADTDELAALAESLGHTARVYSSWDLFAGSAEQITGKLMRLLPKPDGANQHYLDEIRGILQAVQAESPLASVGDLRERVMNPAPYVRDQYDLTMVTQSVDRSGATSGSRALQALLVALRPLEEWIGSDGWNYRHPQAQLTVMGLSPVEDAQARLGDLMLLDLRGWLAERLKARDKTPVLVVVDEFPQLVTAAQDPGDTAGALFETARSAGVGLILAAQSPAGLSHEEARRRRALTSGAALIVGRSKDPDETVKYAGTAMRMEAAGAAAGDQLNTARAQHALVIPPQDVREAADGAFWLVQAGAIAPFRALPNPVVRTGGGGAAAALDDGPDIHDGDPAGAGTQQEAAGAPG